MKKSLLGKLLQRVHADEQGAVSIETVLIIAAIALPILIYLYLKVWPSIKAKFVGDLRQVGVDVSE